MECSYHAPLKELFCKVSVCQSIWVLHIWMAYGISYYNETRITEVQTKRAYVKSLYGSMHPYPDIYFPDMNSYWTYQGSLTTPPLSENVTWLISQNIMGLSEKQVSMVRLWKHAIQGNQGSLLILQFILTVSYTINLFYDGQSINKVSFFEGQNSYLRTASIKFSSICAIHRWMRSAVFETALENLWQTTVDQLARSTIDRCYPVRVL